MDMNERIVARIRTEEDGALSNKRVEQYALLRAEEVVTINAAWLAVMARGDRKKLPSYGYQGEVHKSPAFKRRLEELMAEKAQLEEAGVWGRIEWQARQLYRKCAAMNDVGGMQRATDTLLRVAQKTDKPVKEESPANDSVRRGPGAPPVEVDDPEPMDERIVGKLLDR